MTPHYVSRAARNDRIDPGGLTEIGRNAPHVRTVITSRHATLPRPVQRAVLATTLLAIIGAAGPCSDGCDTTGRCSDFHPIVLVRVSPSPRDDRG